MKKFTSMFAIALLATSMLVSSCKDDDPAPSRTELLTAKSWVIASAEIEYAGQRFPYTTEVFDDCDMDDVTTFTKDGKYTTNVGTNLCGNEKNYTGVWQFKENDTILSVKEEGETEFDDNKITDMTATKIEIFIEEFNFDSNGDGQNDVKAKTYMILKAK